MSGLDFYVFSSYFWSGYGYGPNLEVKVAFFFFGVSGGCYYGSLFSGLGVLRACSMLGSL